MTYPTKTTGGHGARGQNRDRETHLANNMSRCVIQPNTETVLNEHFGLALGGRRTARLLRRIGSQIS